MKSANNLILIRKLSRIDNILIDPDEKLTKWKNYFEGLLNDEVPARPVPPWIDYRVEQEVSDKSMQEVKKAIYSLKN